MIEALKSDDIVNKVGGKFRGTFFKGKPDSFDNLLNWFSEAFSDFYRVDSLGDR